MIGRSSSYNYVVNNLQDAQQVKKGQDKIEANDSDEELDRGSDMEPVDTMAGLIMGFSKLKKQKAPELPPRDDDFSMISEDIESD